MRRLFLAAALVACAGHRVSEESYLEYVVPPDGLEIFHVFRADGSALQINVRYAPPHDFEGMPLLFEVRDPDGQLHPLDVSAEKCAAAGIFRCSVAATTRGAAAPFYKPYWIWIKSRATGRIRAQIQIQPVRPAS